MFKLVLNNGFEMPLESSDVWDAMNESKERVTDAGTVQDTATNAVYFGLVRLMPNAPILVLTASKLRDRRVHFSGA